LDNVVLDDGLLALVGVAEGRVRCNHHILGFVVRDQLGLEEERVALNLVDSRKDSGSLLECVDSGSSEV